MHLLEQYALSSGLKIGKPFIYEVFFPITSKRYISFHPNSKFESKNYDYWQLVIDFIYPILLKNGIDIVQIGTREDKAYKNCTHTQGQSSINQTAYIIKNSELSFGADSFSAHVASGFDKKIVAIYSNNNIANCKPYWSNKQDLVLIEPERGEDKPSYSSKESPKSINKIKPEVIANSILGLLGIKEVIKAETLFIGDNFNDQIAFGFLPNQVVQSNKMAPEIRMDLLRDENYLSSQLARQKSIITTNKSISKEILLKFKLNVANIIYIVEELDEPDFVKFLFENGFAFSCVSKLGPEKLKDKRINYYKYAKIEEHLENDKEKQIKLLLKNLVTQDVKFKTNYVICSNRKNYLSEQHLLDGESAESLNDFNKIKTSDLFLGDLKNLWIIKE